MSQSEPTTQQKQRFLREQILQQGYDAEQFVSFLCKDLQIEQLDVQHIDMTTLQSIVLKFKQYKYYQQPQVTQQTKQKRTKIEYDKQLYDYEFQARWKCIHAEPLVDRLEVFVPSFQIKQTEGIFFSIGSRTEIWFLVQSTSVKTPIRRLNDDFQWLSDTIARVYPLLAVPELLPLGKQQGNHSKRRKELEEYLQLLAKRVELRSSSLLIDFLSLPVEKLQKLRKSWDSIGFAKGVQSVKNDVGYVSVSYTNKLRNFAIGSAQFNRRAQEIQQLIAGTLDRVGALHVAAAEEMNKVVQLFAQLHEVYGELTNRSPQQKAHEYNEVLVNLNNLYHILAEDLAARARVFSAHLKEFHKLQLNYGRSLNRLSRTVTQTQKEYVYFKTNLTRKKERLYPDVSRWEVEEKLLENRRLSKEDAFSLMLPKETQQEEEMRDWLAYLYSNYRYFPPYFSKEFQRYISFQVDRHISTYATLTSELLLNNRTYVEEITKFIQDSRKVEESRKSEEDKRTSQCQGGAQKIEGQK